MSNKQITQLALECPHIAANQQHTSNSRICQKKYEEKLPRCSDKIKEIQSMLNDVIFGGSIIES